MMGTLLLLCPLSAVGVEVLVDIRVPVNVGRALKLESEEEICAVQFLDEIHTHQH